MRAKRFHGLKRIKIRQSWNKYNLYNLTKLKKIYNGATHFQQKWRAKAASRAYHGEQIREKQWQRLFSSKIRSVVPMDHRYLAAFDGSEQARGRGSGRDAERPAGELPAVPYMQMTYAPIERRLDTAIFRALFASSARQARQFVIHGSVKVNGTKIIYPGYLLNPGDMFQVEVERVLFATGAPKDAQERRAGRNLRRKGKVLDGHAADAVQDAQETLGNNNAEPTSSRPEETFDAAVSENGDVLAAKRKTSKVDLKVLLQQAKSILENKKDAPSAKRKQDLRAFTSSVRTALGQVNKKSVKALESTVSDLDNELSNLISQLSVSKPFKSTSTSIASTNSTNSTNSTTDVQISKEDQNALRDALIEARDNPVDPTKAYATPWRPRAYMSAFAFIPRYLEVNQNICAAVYLRHPVARPGLAEVPTPFALETNQLAYAWYLRRR